MAEQLSQQALFERIDANTTLLTPNRRLAATLHKRYAEHKKDQGCWLTPDMLPLSSWIQRLWQDVIVSTADPLPLLLTSTQEHTLWEQVILDTKTNENLLQRTQTADMVKSAWGLLSQWQVPLTHPLFDFSEDYIALRDWITLFLSRCKNEAWLDSASLANIVSKKIEAGVVLPAAQLILIGFTEISPQLKKLLTICEKMGCKVSEIEIIAGQPSSSKISLPDEETEILTMARWAKAANQQNNNTSIGCVIPNLDKIRDRVAQIFADVFDCELFTAPFNISAGKSLSRYPVIRMALHMLGINKQMISRETVSELLMSPFMGDAEKERIKRASFDATLRRNNVNQISLDELDNSLPLLKNRLTQFIQLIDTNKRTYTEWAHHFTEMLTKIGWPGERSLNSEEYQTVDAWMGLLTEFATLDQMAKPCDIKQAWHTLRKMADKLIFQAKTPDAPIQVLGLLEAASLPFDQVWIAGMDDMAWPPQPNPNPFIPKRLQRELQMPHATAEREFEFCTLLTRQFKQSSPVSIFSHAEKIENINLHASPLLSDCHSIDIHALDLSNYQSPAIFIQATKDIETINDNSGPTPAPNEKLSGGVDILKQQALCPFKAFATHRLHAREMEQTMPGLRPKDRGNIVHKVLELVWAKINDHSTLISLNHAELQQLINQAINQALASLSLSVTEESHYMQLEKQRLYKLVSDWLQTEKERPPFAVLNQEKKETITLNQLTLSIRIDRVDKLENGKKLIIDYKTSKNYDIANWFGDRPDEPQLPLYALLDPELSAGIAVAQLAPGTHQFKGISHYTLDIQGIKLLADTQQCDAATWPEQLNEWQTALTKLSDDFYAGNASVSPKDPPQTCEYCALKPLCRIYEHDNVTY